jgi:hypothetical protein
LVAGVLSRGAALLGDHVVDLGAHHGPREAAQVRLVRR